MKSRAGISRQRFRYADAQCYDGKAHAETYAGRIFERITEVIESVAVVEERGDAEVMGQVADDLHSAGNEVLAAIPDRSDLLVGAAFAGAGAGDHEEVSPAVPAGSVARRQLVEGETAHTVIAAGKKP